jgi:hypothetical protein
MESACLLRGLEAIAETTEFIDDGRRPSDQSTRTRSDERIQRLASVSTASHRVLLRNARPKKCFLSLMRVVLLLAKSTIALEESGQARTKAIDYQCHEVQTIKRRSDAVAVSALR